MGVVEGTEQLVQGVAAGILEEHHVVERMLGRQTVTDICMHELGDVQSPAIFLKPPCQPLFRFAGGGVRKSWNKYH